MSYDEDLLKYEAQVAAREAWLKEGRDRMRAALEDSRTGGIPIPRPGHHPGRRAEDLAYRQQEAKIDALRSQLHDQMAYMLVYICGAWTLAMCLAWFWLST